MPGAQCLMPPLQLQIPQPTTQMPKIIKAARVALGCLVALLGLLAQPPGATDSSSPSVFDLPQRTGGQATSGTQIKVARATRRTKAPLREGGEGGEGSKPRASLAAWQGRLTAMRTR